MVEQNLRLNWLARVWYQTMKNSQKLNRRPTIEYKATRSHKRSHIMHNSEKRLDNNSCFINKSWKLKMNLMNSVNIDSRIYLNAKAAWSTSSELESCSFWDVTESTEATSVMPKTLFLSSRSLSSHGLVVRTVECLPRGPGSIPALSSRFYSSWV